MGEPMRIDRRKFLVLSSATAVAGAFTRRAQAQSTATLAISAGYVEQSEKLVADFRAGRFALDYPGVPSRVIPADSLHQGDFSFLQRDARITVHRLVGDPRNPGPRWTMLDVDYQVPLEGRLPYFAWKRADRPYEPRQVSFQVPIPENQGVQFRAKFASDGSRRHRAVGATPTSDVISRLVLSGEGPKLWRGIYFLALHQTDQKPAWDRYRFIANGRIIDFRGYDPEFEYILLSIDYARNDETTL